MKMTVTTNDAGQKRFKGTITLKEDTIFLNTKNNGSSPFDLDWDKEYSIIVDKGTIVQYLGQETRRGFHHTVSLRRNGKRFSSSKSTEKGLRV